MSFDYQLKFRVSSRTKKEIERAAKSDGVDVSTYLRGVIERPAQAATTADVLNRLEQLLATYRLPSALLENRTKRESNRVELLVEAIAQHQNPRIVGEVDQKIRRIASGANLEKGNQSE